MKSKLEIINETVQYYTEDPNRRAILEDGTCTYESNDGKKCAVGRCLEQSFIDTLKLTGSLQTSFSQLVPRNGPPTAEVHYPFKDEYRGHNYMFWDDLQEFHDYNLYWDEKGLTERGREYVNKIKARYENS